MMTSSHVTYSTFICLLISHTLLLALSHINPSLNQFSESITPLPCLFLSALAGPFPHFSMQNSAILFLSKLTQIVCSGCANYFWFQQPKQIISVVRWSAQFIFDFKVRRPKLISDFKSKSNLFEFSDGQSNKLSRLQIARELFEFSDGLSEYFCFQCEIDSETLKYIVTAVFTEGLAIK